MGIYVPYNPKNEEFLNNFYTRFPVGEGSSPEGLYRMLVARYLDQTNRIYFQSQIKTSFKDQKDMDDYCSKYSDLYLDQTPKQFIATLDETVVELGLSIEQIIQNNQRSNEASKDLFVNDEFRAICILASTNRDNYLRPVYAALRGKGYNKKELWG